MPTTATTKPPAAGAAEAPRAAKTRAHEKYQRLIDFCKTLPPTPTAVAHPCDQSSLQGAVATPGLGFKVQMVLFLTTGAEAGPTGSRLR